MYVMDKKPRYYKAKYGMTYECNHPVYNKCTLYKINDKGLSVIQQRYDPITKRTWWGEIDAWLIDDIYLHPKFKQFFEERSGVIQDNLYDAEDVRLFKSVKGNWLLVYKANYSNEIGRALTEEEAKQLLLNYDLEVYEKLFGKLEEA